MGKNRELADLAGKDLATQAELDAAVASSTEINDGTVSATDTWSSQKIDTDKQDTLVSGTNIKTINDISLLGSGNIAIESFLPNMVEAITSSTTWTAPKTGRYRITAVGAGGSGGNAKNISIAVATGGGAGGVCIHETELSIGETLTIIVGAGSRNLGENTNGVSGGNTTVVGSSFTLTANGGGGGKYGISNELSVLGGVGGTASGGNIANITGGAGGSFSSTAGFNVYASTGGGGASLNPLAITRGGNVSINDNVSFLISTGGGSCFFRGGDVITPTNTSASGGGGTGGNGQDVISSTANSNGGGYLNIFNGGFFGEGAGGSGSTYTEKSTSLFGSGGGGRCTANIDPRPAALCARPFGGGGGHVVSAPSNNYTTDVSINNFLAGGGSGGVVNGSASYTVYSVSGFKGIVFIEYKGY